MGSPLELAKTLRSRVGQIMWYVIGYAQVTLYLLWKVPAMPQSAVVSPYFLLLVGSILRWRIYEMWLAEQSALGVAADKP